MFIFSRISIYEFMQCYRTNIFWIYVVCEYEYHVEKDHSGCGIFSIFRIYISLDVPGLVTEPFCIQISAFQFLHFFLNLKKKKVAWDCCEFQYMKLYCFWKSQLIDFYIFFYILFKKVCIGGWPLSCHLNMTVPHLIISNLNCLLV